MKWAAIIAAAGRGTRLQRPKQLLEVAGSPLVSWCMRTFAQISEISEVVVVTETDAIDPVMRLAESIFSIPVRVVQGGATRQESVGRGLAAISQACDAVFIHDGARPLVRADDVRAGMATTRDGHAAALGTPCVDTLKVVDAQTCVVRRTLDRATVWAAQTPQFAMLTDLRQAHERARAEGVQATDDTALLERIGIEVVMVSASGTNIKVTNPEDLILVEMLLKGAVV